MPNIDATHDLCLKNGAFDGTSPADLKALFENVRATNLKTLVVHIHGGLCNRNGGLTTARAIQQDYLNAGAYPVFFIWQSGVEDVLVKKLQEIAQETIFNRLLIQATRGIVGKLNQPDGARAVLNPLEMPNEADVRSEYAFAGKIATREAYKQRREDTVQDGLTEAEQAQFRAELENDDELRAGIGRVVNMLKPKADGSRAANIPGEEPTLISKELQVELLAEVGEDRNRDIVSIGIAIIERTVRILVQIAQRFVNKSDHGVHATVVEEILRGLYLDHVGDFFWGGMKEIINNAFSSDDRGGSAFLHELKQHQDITNNATRVLLVGHSAGAIYICKLLEAAATIMPEQVFDVVFQAPACDYQTFAQTLEQHQDRMANFRMFTMFDAREREDVLIPDNVFPTEFAGFQRIYPSSLLYFVSGICEPTVDAPLLGMERYFNNTLGIYDGPAFNATRAYLNPNDHPNRIVWSITENANPGLNTTAIDHGLFSTDAKILESLEHIIQAGF